MLKDYSRISTMLTMTLVFFVFSAIGANGSDATTPKRGKLSGGIAVTPQLPDHPHRQVVVTFPAQDQVKIFDATSFEKQDLETINVENATPLSIIQLPSGARPTAVTVSRVETEPRRSETLAFVVNEGLDGFSVITVNGDQSRISVSNVTICPGSGPITFTERAEDDFVFFYCHGDNRIRYVSTVPPYHVHNLPARSSHAK